MAWYACLQDVLPVLTSLNVLFQSTLPLPHILYVQISQTKCQHSTSTLPCHHIVLVPYHLFSTSTLSCMLYYQYIMNIIARIPEMNWIQKHEYQFRSQTLENRNKYLLINQQNLFQLHGKVDGCRSLQLSTTHLCPCTPPNLITTLFLLYI